MNECGDEWAGKKITTMTEHTNTLNIEFVNLETSLMLKLITKHYH